MIDTHIFLWWDMRSPRLSEAGRQIMAAPTNRVFVSAASIWEIAIKRRVSKLAFTGSPLAAVSANSFVTIDISGADAEAAGDLDWAHTDPFDRMIIAQAQNRSMVLVSADAVMRSFTGVEVVPGH